MKLLLLLILLVPGLLQAQDITGKWNGMLSVQGMELRLVFHISREGPAYSAKMDSPDQKVFGIPVSAVKFEGLTLHMEIARIGAQFEGKYSADSIAGTFYQLGQSFPLSLSRGTIEKKALLRPQEPKPPYPYRSEEVKFPSEEGKIQLAGTLTMPEGGGKFPAAVLISGSGPQNRDEEFMTHKPFLVLADYLTRKGIAVLRYDDRGFGQSTGNHGNATSADFANDVRAAAAYLKTRKEIDEKHIGLVGHSEGGLIAPIAAADTETAFMVLLAAPGLPGSEILLRQAELAGRLQGLDESRIQNTLEITRGVFELFEQYGGEASLETRLQEYLNNAVPDSILPAGTNKEQFIKAQASLFSRPWMRYFLKYNPVNSLKNIKCPVLALQGGKDVQVAPENLPAIEKALRQGGNNRVAARMYPDMNHLFQTCTTGAIDEYAAIEQTIDPLVLEEIAAWVLKQTK